MQTGLFNGFASFAPALLQGSGLRVRVLVDGVPVAPGPVLWDSELRFFATTAPMIDLQLRAGVRSYTFVARNLPVPRSGIHNIVVQAQFALLDVPFSPGLAASAAYIGPRTLAVKLVDFN
jgi:hypothetical protein